MQYRIRCDPDPEDVRNGPAVDKGDGKADDRNKDGIDDEYPDQLMGKASVLQSQPVRCAGADLCDRDDEPRDIVDREGFEHADQIGPCIHEPAVQDRCGGVDDKSQDQIL